MEGKEEIEGSSFFGKEHQKQLVEIRDMVSDMIYLRNKKIDQFVWNAVNGYVDKFSPREFKNELNETEFKLCLDILKEKNIFVVVELDERNSFSNFDFDAKEFKIADLSIKVQFLTPEAPIWRGEKPKHHIRRIIG